MKIGVQVQEESRNNARDEKQNNTSEEHNAAS